MAEARAQRFEKVATNYNFPAMEESIQRFWEAEEIFAKSLEKPAPRGNWVFYEGPPTANALPHPGHVLTRVIKDCLPRFKTMQGHYVRRQAGWDTHGLPVELSVEKELIAAGEMSEGGPDAIRKYGLEEFNRKCFESVRRYEAEWVKLSNRIGFWLDYDNAYFTFTNQYIESVWWLLKQIYDKGLMYKGYRIQWYSTLVGTGLSSHEVAQNWQEVRDPSVWVKARINTPDTSIGGHVVGENTYLLLWTTTPWTLLSNVALCVHPDFDYVVVRFHEDTENHKPQYLVLAEGLLQANGLEAEHVVARVKGKDLAGLNYDRLFDYDVPDIRRDGAETSGWRVVADKYVTLEDGTGIVHLAPAFGEDDYRIGIRENLPVLNAMDANGRAVEGVKLSAGKWFKEIDPDVITDLKYRGILFKTQKIAHNYPHCYRTDAPLMSYPLDSWFIKTTAVKDELIAGNQQIDWKPEHIREGRFGDWLNNVVDWSLSRDRFWGTPLPVWACEGCGETECLGSYAELKEKCPEKFAQVSDDYDQSQFNPHRPYIDDFHWDCGKCGGQMTRERYVIDPWFDAGSMPFSQLHYPFENKELVDGDGGEDGVRHTQFPCEFISEAVDQTRGWFYTLHAIATIIKGTPSYKRCLVLGHITDEKGRKMSKRHGNYVDPWTVLDAHGADAFRWYFYSAGNLFGGARFGEAGVVEGLQRFIIPLWNVYSFFTIYANIDDFDPAAERLTWDKLTELDRWILLKLNRLVSKVTSGLENLELTQAAEELEAFADMLTNWYVRRSRRRFWQSEHDDAKLAAYQTLYRVLTTLAHVIAPFTPFLAEELYQKLSRRFDDQLPESVHLSAWPEADGQLCDDELEQAMDQARRIVNLGHAARKDSGVRVRQPLSRITLVSTEQALRQSLASQLSVVLDELNVKQVEWAEDEREFVHYEYKPSFRALGPLFGNAAKAVADWIASNPGEVARQLSEHESTPIPPLSDPEGEATHNWLEFTCESTYTKKVDGKKQTFTETVEAKVDDTCFEVLLKEKPETVAQRDGNLLLVLDTHVSDELKQEGLAREVVNRLQGMRKTLDLDYADRIKVSYTTPDELEAAIDAHREYIQAETLATELTRVDSLSGEPETTEIDGMEFAFSVAGK